MKPMADRVVFVDESFFKWFGLPDDEGNFCYAAVSVPSASMAQMDQFTAALERTLIRFWESDTGQSFRGGEVKSKLIYELSTEHKRAIAAKLAYFLAKNGGSLFVFFTTSRGLIHNLLRDKYYDEYGKVYDDFLSDPDQEMSAVRDELLAAWKVNPCNVALLQPMYEKLVSFIWTYHKELGERFTIQYDPREASEDRILNNNMVDAVRMYDKAVQALHEPGIPNALACIDSSIPSSDCPGLRLADFVATDARRLFRAVPGLLEDASEKRILSAKANPQMTIIGGRAPFYRRVLAAPTMDAMAGCDLLFPHIRSHFARSFVSCHAKYGEARHINVTTGEVWDMAD